ncbi:MAG: chorismate mutase [Candidatus Latescibacterota bacterium]
MDAIDGWRERIDALDAQLLELLNERARCAIEVGKVKTERGMTIHNPEREKFVLNRLKEKNRGPLDNGAIERIFQRIIEECRRIEITAL